METKKLKEVFNIGETIVITNGCYSDYTIIDYYICRKAFIPKKLIAELASVGQKYMSQKTPSEKMVILHLNDDEFVKYLIAEGYIELINSIELHLSEYGEYFMLLSDYEKYTGKK